MADRSDHVFVSGLPQGIQEQQLKDIFGQYGQVLWCRLFTNNPLKIAGLLQFSSPDEARDIVQSLNGSMLNGQVSEPVSLEVSAGGGNKKGGGKGGGFNAGGGAPRGNAGGGFNARPGPYGAASPLVDLGSLLLGGGKGGGKGGGYNSPGGLAGKGGGQSAGGILQLKNDLQVEQLLPGGKWSNDTQAALHIGGLPADTTDVDLYEIFSPFGAIPSKGARAMTARDGSGSCSGVGFVNFLDPAHAEAAVQALNGRALKDGKTLHVKPKQPKGFVPAAPAPGMPQLGSLGAFSAHASGRV